MGALWQFDQDVFHAVQGLRQPWLDSIMVAVTSTGLGWVQVLLIMGFFAEWKSLARPAIALGFRATRGDSSRTWMLIPLLLAYATSGVLNQAVKQLVERERPSNLPTANPLEQIFYNSFVSGHTATSFGIATALMWLTSGTPRRSWGRVALVWAALVGFSRVYVGVHWPTDVVGGAAVGVLCGTWIGWSFRPTESNDGYNPVA